MLPSTQPVKPTVACIRKHSHQHQSSCVGCKSVSCGSGLLRSCNSSFSSVGGHVGHKPRSHIDYIWIDNGHIQHSLRHLFRPSRQKSPDADSSFIASVILILPGCTSDFLLLELSAVLGGMGEVMFLSTWNAYLADTTTEESRPATFSLSFVTFTIASGVGSFLPGIFPLMPLSLFDAHRVTFVTLGRIGIGTPLSVFRWASDVRPKTSRGGILPRKSLGIIVKFSTANMMIALGAGLIIPLIPTWFYLRFNETDVFSGPLIAVSNLLLSSILS